MAISLEKLLKNIKYDNINPKAYSELISTNLTAKDLGLKGEKSGALIIAERQIGGRGRLGRSFFSEVGGAYFSLLLRPSLKPEDITLITPMAAVAVAKAITRLSGKSAKIKWVNDILIDNKKVAGILTETVFVGGNPITILGIGVNLYPWDKGFPAEIKDIAGTVFEMDEGITERFIAEVINCFYELYNALPDLFFISEYKDLSMLIGKEISYLKENKTFFGKVLDIDNRCRLIVSLKEGQTETLSSGEVTLKSSQFTN